MIFQSYDILLAFASKQKMVSVQFICVQVVGTLCFVTSMNILKYSFITLY